MTSDSINADRNFPDESSKITLPTFFPSGFTLKETADGMIIIDFLDQRFEGMQPVIASVALTRERAKLFAEKMLESVKEGNYV